MLHGLIELIENLGLVHLLGDALPDLGETSEHALRVFMHVFLNDLEFEKATSGETPITQADTRHMERLLTGLSNRRFGAD